MLFRPFRKMEIYTLWRLLTGHGFEWLADHLMELALVCTAYRTPVNVPLKRVAPSRMARSEVRKSTHTEIYRISQLNVMVYTIHITHTHSISTRLNLHRISINWPFRLNSVHRQMLIASGSVRRYLWGHVRRRAAVWAGVRHWTQAILHHRAVQAVPTTLTLVKVNQTVAYLSFTVRRPALSLHVSTVTRM